MKNITIEVGCNYQTIDKGHAPCGHRFRANALINIVGSYGIVSGGNECKRRRVSVLVPDWIAPSAEYIWPLARPGYRSSSGTADQCFVVCNETPSVEVDIFGSANQDALIDAAIASGLSLYYPNERGDMEHIAIELAEADNS